MHILQILMVAIIAFCVIEFQNVHGYASSAYKIRTKDKEKCVASFTHHAYQKQLFEDKSRSRENVSVAVYFIPERGAGFVCGYKANTPCFPNNGAEVDHFVELLNASTGLSFDKDSERDNLIRRTRHEFCASGQCTNAAYITNATNTTNTNNETGPICSEKCIRGLSCTEVDEHGITLVYENGDPPSTSTGNTIMINYEIGTGTEIIIISFLMTMTLTLF